MERIPPGYDPSAEAICTHKERERERERERESKLEFGLCRSAQERDERTLRVEKSMLSHPSTYAP